MNILQLMPQFPFPPTDGGKVGLANITKHFALAGHSVHLVCNGQNVDKKDLLIAEQFATVHIQDIDTKNSPGRIFASLFSSRALYITKQDSYDIRRVIREIVEQHRIDVIHADHTSMAPIANWASKTFNIPWGLRLHNIEHIIWQRYADSIPGWNPQKWYLLREAQKLKREELTMMKMAHVLFPITPADAALIPSRSAPYTIAPAGVNADQWNVEADWSARRVVMASTFAWVHNANALRWFIDNVWGLIRKDVPNATLHICGLHVPSWIGSYSTQGVVNQGFVPSLEEFYSGCAVSIAPLFVGSGMRIKIIEAMAAGLPVVATKIGAEGIECDEDGALLATDDPIEQAGRVVELLMDREKWQGAGQSAKCCATEKYAWKSSIGVMLDAYKHLKP